MPSSISFGFGAVILADSKNPWMWPIELAVAPDPGSRVAMEGKLLMGTLEGPNKIARAPKGLPMDVKKKSKKKMGRIIKLRPVFLLIPQTSDRITFFLHFPYFSAKASHLAHFHSSWKVSG